MDNKSAFNVNQYDENVRKVIPFYDEIYQQIFSLIHAYYGDEKISVLDTGFKVSELFWHSYRQSGFYTIK